jgi:ADP-heptose:LPS heptosyltransferase
MGIGSVASPRSGPVAKCLDWYLGIPLVFLLGLFRRKRTRPDTIRRIGALKTAGIGDAVLLTGPLQDLRKRFPGVELVLFLGVDNYHVAPLIPEGIEVVKLPVKSPLKSTKIIRQFDLDAFIDFGPWPRINAVYVAFSRSRYKVGFLTRGQYRHYAYDEFVTHSFDVHELGNYRNLSRLLGAEANGAPELQLPSSTLSGIPPVDLARSIVFHPWPGGAAKVQKMWPEDRWIELARALNDEGHRILITGAGSDCEPSADLVRKLRSQGCQARSLAGELSLAETASVLRNARAVVSVDTGIMHVASVLGSRVVALHGPTAPKRWGATGPLTIPVTSKVEGSGYINLGFEVPHDPPPCMEDITVAAVHDALRNLTDHGKRIRRVVP